ncbi:MAG: dipeptidyl-peptidase-4, partial [Myxococcota bacterium]
QEEMSRYHGYWWSPDGKQLLIQRTDNTDVERLWIADSKRPERAPSSAPYPRAGTRNAHVELHLFDLAAPEGTSARAVDWDRGRYPYLASVRWKYTKAPTLVVQNRRQTESVILSWAPDTGTISTLHTEADNAWVNLDQSVPRWLPDGKHFLWSTERNGDWQLEKRAADGSLVNTVTDVDLGYRELVHIDAKAGTAVIRMQPNPLEMHLARVPLAGGKAEQITTAVGGHSATFGDRGVWAHTHVAEDGTSTVRLKSATGEAKGTLTSLAPRPPRIPVVEYTTVKTADRQLQAALIRPSNYEDGRKYPVVVYVYGGPHYQVVTRNRMRYWVQQWIADHGFVVVMLDGRGTPGKGRMWERSIKNDVITGPLKDQVDGLQALGVRYPELDMERVGLYGWSFGGYFSAMAVLRRPDVYKAGFSGAPVTDWRDYDTHYTERYMGLPAENKAGYDSTSAVVNAGKLTVPLTIAHGTVDDNVYFIHALKLSNALFEARRDHVFLPLSGYTHMVRGKKATLALFDRIAGWFVQHLGQPE